MRPKNAAAIPTAAPTATPAAGPNRSTQLAAVQNLQTLPTVQPFATGSDLIGEAEARHRFESGTYDLDSSLEKMRADTSYQKSNIDKSATQATADTTWDMAGRGLQASSIRDGALYDIDATATIRKNYLQTQLDTAIIEAGRRKKQLSDWWDNWQKGFAQQKVENAAAVQPAVPDQKPQPAAPTKDTWASQLGLNMSGNGSFPYSDGAGQFRLMLTSNGMVKVYANGAKEPVGRTRSGK